VKSAAVIVCPAIGALSNVTVIVPSTALTGMGQAVLPEVTGCNYQGFGNNNSFLF
jgi:hypothetical protein